MTKTPQVAISDDFLRAYSKLPKAQQKKVRAFTEKFRRDPTQASINYERLHKAADTKVRSVRVGDDYRAIVVHPPTGDVYLCVWVDHHDEAMAWARNRRFEVNRTTGALQVYRVREAEERAKGPEAADAPAAAPPPAGPPASAVAAEADAPAIPAGRLFSGAREEDLLLLGVPELLLPSVRALRTEADLDDLAPYLPMEASDALYWLAAGGTPEEALEERERARSADERVDTNDFAAALDRPESQSRFKLVDDERDLLEMLNAPLAQWRVFLHPSQRKLVRMKANGPVRVLGGAGTGKTVVAIHRARHLARTVFSESDDRILVTTYTRNLAKDLEQHLATLCGPELERIEVANLHLWAVRFMRKHGRQFFIANERLRSEAWTEALGAAGDAFPPDFLKDEWDKVVQAQDVTDLAGYFRARRVGRGRRLSHRQRRQVWEALSGYRARLDRAGKVEWPDVIRETRLYIEQHPGLLPYRAVVADEVQDFREADLRFLRSMVPPGPNDLFVVGDAHQRIYGYKASLLRCGIEIRGRARRLKVNYRTTEQVRRWAVALLEGVEVDDLNDGLDTMKGYRSLRTGPEPVVATFTSAEQEAAFIVERVRAWAGDGEPDGICLVARTHDLVATRYRPLLEQAGVSTVLIDTDAESGLGPGVRLATMHRVKGLEFPRMLLAETSTSAAPSAPPDDLAERCLRYVAATRARDELVVVGFG